MEPPKPGQKWQGKLRLIIQYVFSKTKMLTGYINMWQEQIALEEQELKDLRAVLKHMESPFGFIKGFQLEQNVKKNIEEKKEEVEAHKQQALMNWELSPEMQERLANLEEKEKAVEVKIDAVSKTIAEKMGYEEVPWFKLTWYLLWIYTAITIVIMTKREDFVNLTICTTALYMMFHTERITRDYFRVLVLGILLSLLYDALWFFMKHQEYTEEQKADGGQETNIRRIVLLFSYVAFLLKVNSPFICFYRFFRFLWPWCSGRTQWTSPKSFRTRSLCRSSPPRRNEWKAPSPRDFSCATSAAPDEEAFLT